MPGEKRFATSLFGFKKADVNSYIEKILREFDEKIKDRDSEISLLKNQIRENKLKNEELVKKSEQAHEGKDLIADVLIKAQEKAELIMEEARQAAKKESDRLDMLLEEERERLVDMKEQVRILKSGILNTIKKYDQQLTDVYEDKVV